MTQTELNKYRAMLEAKRDELRAGLRNRDGIAIEQTADKLDEGLRASERDLAVRSINRGSDLLRDVRAALERIADGSYGSCCRCEADIKLKRLEAVPHAAYCLACQETNDHRGDSREMLEVAA